MKKNLIFSLETLLLAPNWEADNLNTQILEDCFELDENLFFSNHLVLKSEFENTEFYQNPKIRKQILNVANSLSRSRKNRLYEAQKSKGKIRILAEGDSWFEYPLKKIQDTLDHLGRYYAVKSIAGGGDELRHMFRTAEYIEIIKRENPAFFLISAGGNDFLGNAFDKFLRKPELTTSANSSPNSYLNDLFHSELKALSQIFEVFFHKILQADPNITILIHGYDYILPQISKKKKNLGNILENLQITEFSLQKDILKCLIDEFNLMLQQISSKFAEKVQYVDLRNTIQTHHWHDEIHPNSKGYLDISIKFMKKIDSLLR